MKKTRKTLTILLATILIISFMPTMAFADGEAQNVAKIGETEYATLADAIEAVPATGTETTITMIGDELIGDPGLTIAEGKKIVLELAGHKIAGHSEAATTFAVITNYGTLTIQDSTDKKKDGSGEGLISAQIDQPAASLNPGYASNTVTNAGTLTIKSGKYTNSGLGTGCFVIDNNSSAHSPVLNIEGGYILQSEYSSNVFAYVVRMFDNSSTNDNIVNISGGILEGGYGFWLQVPNTSNNKATVNISGGVFKGKGLYGGAISMSFYIGPNTGSNDYSNYEISISGGEFLDAGVGLAGAASQQKTFAKCEITGGKFTKFAGGSNLSKMLKGGVYGAKPAANLIADGYEVVKNYDIYTMGNYPWAISPAADENVQVAQDEAKVEVGENVPQESKEAVSEAAAKTEVEGLEFAALEEAEGINADEAKAALAEALSKQVQEIEEDVTIYAKTFLDVQPQTYSSTAVQKEYTVDIKPMVQMFASTAESAEDIETGEDGKNAVKLGEAKELEVTTAVYVTIPLPAGFANVGDTLYIKHIKDDGKTYIYPCQVQDDNGTLYVEFLNSNGFSVFSITTENTSVASITRGASTMHFESLKGAFDEILDGETVVLQKNLSGESGKIEINKEIRFRIDSNGHTGLEVVAGDGYKVEETDGLYIVSLDDEPPIDPEPEKKKCNLKKLLIGAVIAIPIASLIIKSSVCAFNTWKKGPALPLPYKCTPYCLKPYKYFW